MAKEQVKVDMFNWGPCVVRIKISEEFRKLLLSEAKKNKDDMRGKLAGQIDIETAYSEESKAKILPYMSNCLGIYDQAGALQISWSRYGLITKRRMNLTHHTIMMVSYRL